MAKHIIKGAGGKRESLYKMAKKTKNELLLMTSTQIAQHIVDITQTSICKDEKYCKMINEIFIIK